MKKNDMVLIIVVVIVSGIFSLILSNLLFGSPKKHDKKVPVVEPISGDFARPSENPDYQKFYKSTAINPTQLIKIGDSANSKPFSGPQ